MHPQYEKANKASEDAIGAAIEVQKNFGTGLLESVYAKCLSRELELRGHDVKSEFPVSICYKGFEFKEKLRVDLLVDNSLVIEVKARNATRKEIEAFKAQTLSYLKLLDKPLGLLINFNIDQVGKYGTKRIMLKGADEERSDESAIARSEARATYGTSSERNFADFASNKDVNPYDLQLDRDPGMTARERLQLAYELAFLPRRLNGKWRGWVADVSRADPDELKALDEAAMLLLPLPESRVVPTGALYRLAIYQAGAALYGMRTFIGNVRKRLNRPEITASEVPPAMVRDVALPGYHVPEF